MATPTPQEMIDLLTQALADSKGAVEIHYSDGRRIKYDRATALKELAYWESKLDLAASGGLSFTRLSLKGDA